MDSIENKLFRINNYFKGILIYEDECNFKYFKNIKEICKENKDECKKKIKKFIKCKEGL